MFISEVQNKKALQRTLMSHRTMTDSAQWPVGAVSSSACLFYQNMITFPTSFLVSPFVEMSVIDIDLKSLEI